MALLRVVQSVRPPLGSALVGALLGALLLTLLYQLPARHVIDLGGRDASYLQGFVDQPNPNQPTRIATPLAAIRWPQLGQPATIVLRLRAEGSAAPVGVRLNGALLAEIHADGTARDVVLPVRGGFGKAFDVLVTFDLPPEAQFELVAAAIATSGWPILPYPAQLFYATVAGGLLGLLGWRSRRQQRVAAAAGLGLALLYLAFYRYAPSGHIFLLLLPSANLLLLGALLWREGAGWWARWPWLDAALSAAIGGVWLVAIGRAASAHLTLARPGVENDFRVFATRDSLSTIFSADGFYNLGYPLLLWLARPLASDNPFLAGRMVAALSGLLLLLAGYLLARRLLGRGPALLALLLLATSGFVAQYGLFVGSDMPCAALFALAVALLCPPHGAAAPRMAAVLGAGAAAGAAFLMRHPALLLLPWGLALLWWLGSAGRGRLMLGFAAAFLLAISPQLLVNLLETGNPLANQQAKNIWLAVYAGGDWGRWDEAPNSIGLLEVMLRDPARFWQNWWLNQSAFWGRGAEDTSEFGRAVLLRLLGFPANLLAFGGLVLWLWPLRRAAPLSAQARVAVALVALIVLYAAAVGTAFLLPRFVLPLTPIIAVAAAAALAHMAASAKGRLAQGLVLLVVLWGGFSAGTTAVLSGQPADELAAIRAVRQLVPPEAAIAARVPARLPLDKYSAISHQIIDWPGAADGRATRAEDLASAYTLGARYLLWDSAAGLPPTGGPTLQLLSGEGRFTLYQLTP